MFQLLLLVDSFGMVCYAITAVGIGLDPDAVYLLAGLALVGGGVYNGFVSRRAGGRAWRPLALVLPIALIGMIFGLPVLVGHY